MRSPRIGITTYHRNNKGETRLPCDYADAVRRAGGIPLLIQPGESRMDELVAFLDGIILSGGGDVDPQYYTEERHEKVYAVDEERDSAEFKLTEIAIENDVPLFCICRGLQVLNVALGGTLIAHIPDAMPESMDHRHDPDVAPQFIQHDVSVSAESRLGQIVASETVTTASWHHQAIDKLGNGLTVTASAADGIIEAVELADKPVMGVQWHPEATAAEDSDQQRIFDAFVRQAREKMSA
ncbi:MAG: gamma-glutamyl-gamma-aminobutyrate hydrolase family protein [Candidatus Promineifilaceae bacterium]